MAHDPAFLYKTEPADLHRRHRRRRRWHVLLISSATILGVWLFFVLLVGGQLAAHAYDAKDGLDSAQENASALRFEEASDDISSAGVSLASARKSLVYLKRLNVVPFLDDQLDHADAILLASTEVIGSLNEILNIGSDVTKLAGLTSQYLEDVKQGLAPNITFEDLPSETKEAILGRLSASANDIELLQAQVHVARQEFELILKKNTFNPFVAFLQSADEQLTKADEQLSMLHIAARVLPEFSGLGAERTHLLLFLNNDELRPGGGFVGAYGVARIENGELNYLRTEDVYTLDQAADAQITRIPPHPLSTYNAATKWYFRDGNWSPDFAESSKNQVSQFISETAFLTGEQRGQIASDTRVDMVIGFTPSFISELLKVTGPLVVDDQTFAFDNVAALLEYQVEKGYADKGIPPAQRKEILADVVTQMREKMYHLPVSSWSDIISATQSAFVSKQLVMYSHNESTQHILRKVGWSGAVESTTVDTQMVVDANLASLKSDPVVQREILYEIFRNSNGQQLGRTTISYSHNGSFDWRTTRYRTYTRVFVPKGSQLIRVKGSLLNDKTKNAQGTEAATDVFEELGFTVFGTFTSIEPGETRKLIFEYELAPQVKEAIATNTYALSVLKQIGARNYPLTLQLDFDKKVSNAVPAEERGQWGDDLYRLNTILDQDQMFSVSL